MMRKMLQAEFCSDLFNNDIKRWIHNQRWYLEKSDEIGKITIIDYYKMRDSQAVKIYGFVCNINGHASASIYFIPLLFLKTAGMKNGQGICRTTVGGIEYEVLPAEHEEVYQKQMMKFFRMNRIVKTYYGNKAEFKNRLEDGGFFSGNIRSKNLLEDSGSTSSNILTDVETGAGHVIVKTIKKAASDIEMEMYEALSGEGYGGMPGYYASSLIDLGTEKIPLCLVIQKIKGPSIKKSENWKFKAGYIISDLFMRFMEEFKINPDGADADGLTANIMDCSVIGTFDDCGDSEGKFPEHLVYRNMIKRLGEAVAGFNVSLARSRLENFGTSDGDKELINEKYIIGSVISIEKKIDSLGNGNTLFGKYFADSVNSIIMKTEMMINMLPDIRISRIHGDMQMDQILYDDNFNPIIIDFGGAPVMDKAAKREKAPAFYDLAGLIRAFGYIKFYVLKKIFGITNGEVFDTIINGREMERGKAAGASKFACFVEEMFGNILTEGYLDYFERNGETGLVMDKWNRDAAMMLIEFCTISRALYEINYELSARPSEENALIPLESILRALI